MLHFVEYFIFLEYNDIRGNNNRRIKISTKKIRENVVLESCNSWINRLYLMSQNNGDYLK